jgi:hypothetical protein
MTGDEFAVGLSRGDDLARRCYAKLTGQESKLPIKGSTFINRIEFRPRDTLSLREARTSRMLFAQDPEKEGARRPSLDENAHMGANECMSATSRR